ncbi:hypothetical protein DPMN_030942 [Dreissena polymorpha]|uniref:Uncharacterized protein n=1 Tax=Dreissena polymorpha TaxID=45954 RepID=A0A9D4M0X7_DREPO|nr:hypothetical protein DPMN_030942 [Dreissena polymorpha]
MASSSSPTTSRESCIHQSKRFWEERGKITHHFVRPISFAAVAREEEMITGSNNKTYSTLKVLMKTSQPNATVIADAYGTLLPESVEVLNRWT